MPREVDPHWDKVHRALMLKIQYLERDLLMLHEDYMHLEQRLNGALGWARRYWAQQDIEIANRRAAKAANE